jgi:RHS repeat-associated protein
VRQLVDSAGGVALAKSYAPFGGALASAGSGTTIFAFTGEVVDQTGLVYLRARYMAPTAGRFTSRDLWDGVTRQPLSHNKWLYAFANPVAFLDPSGTIPIECVQPDGCSPDLPQTYGYDEKVPPRGVSWHSNATARLITYSPILNSAGRLVHEENAAQFQVAGHTTNYSLCGQVPLAAILAITDADVSVAAVQDQLTKLLGVERMHGTYPSDLVMFVNELHGAEWKAEWRENAVNSIFDLADWFTNGYVVMPIVEILRGSSCPYEGFTPEQRAACKAESGKLGDSSGDISHWILVTGVSSQRQLTEESPWNWVRILNPFDNDFEYYWWPDFEAAWDSEIYYEQGAVYIRRTP